MTIIGCCPNEDPNPTNPKNIEDIPESRIFLSVDNKVQYDFSFSACNRTPSASTAIGTNPVLILFSPGVFYPKDSVIVPDDLDFYFIFHDVRVQYTGSPSLDEFWSYLQQNNHEFNAPPFKRDFFLKIKKGGKVYKNWWNGDLLNFFLQDISIDETGLEFKNYEFNKFDKFGDICLHDYKVLRLKGEINGILVTEDYSDTINVNGNVDLFLNFR